MLSREGIIAVISFSFSLLVQLVGSSKIGKAAVLKINNKFFSSVYAVLILYFIVYNLILAAFFHSSDFQIAFIAGFLGYTFGAAILIGLFGPDKFKPFGIYLVFLTIFHFSEYVSTSFSHPESLHPIYSFLLNQSFQYQFALICSWIEFFLEAHFFPGMKKVKTLWIVGSTVCLIGEILRKAAILTAKKSFHQLIQIRKSEDHKLVTSGVYSIFRHPSYVGWFYWSLGTQVILANPICFIFYGIFGWLFFEERIFIEEITLVGFFGDEYIKYRNNTPTGLPFL